MRIGYLTLGLMLLCSSLLASGTYRPQRPPSLKTHGFTRADISDGKAIFSRELGEGKSCVQCHGKGGSAAFQRSSLLGKSGDLLKHIGACLTHQDRACLPEAGVPEPYPRKLQAYIHYAYRLPAEQ